MACVIKRPGSKFFIACWTDPNGRRLKRSTKKVNRSEALKLALSYEEATRVKRTAVQARRVMGDLFRDLMGELPPTVTVKGFFDDFVARKTPEVSASTLAYYKGNSNRFLAWLGEQANRDISDVTKQMIIAYRNHLAAKASPSTTNNGLKCIKTFFAAARKDGHVTEDCAIDVDLVRDRTESPRRPFTLKELRAVLEVADAEWRSLIYFAFYTGQRLGDVAGLTWSNLDLKSGEVRLTTTKTGRRMALPLAAPLLAHVATLEASDDPKAPLHPRAAGILLRNAGRSGPLSKQFGEILIAAGLRTADAVVKKGDARVKHDLSFHSLRHTATSLLKTAGIPDSAVMAFVGHDDATSSQGYTHTGMEALEQAAAALPTL